jgi:hypothetical protein
VTAPKLGTVLMTFVLGLFLAQLVPYGREHTNPPDGIPASFDSPVTEDLARRACFDCHSNRTRWPWYASIAPISWRIQRHVIEGREKLNFTAFDATTENMVDAAGEAGESVTKGEMPPKDYLLVHSEARLTPEESATLATGLDATFSQFLQEGTRTGHQKTRPKNAGPHETDGTERGEHRD